jgi:hypothetical protein
VSVAASSSAMPPFPWRWRRQRSKQDKLGARLVADGHVEQASLTAAPANRHNTLNKPERLEGP